MIEACGKMSLIHTIRHRFARKLNTVVNLTAENLALRQQYVTLINDLDDLSRDLKAQGLVSLSDGPGGGNPLAH